MARTALDIDEIHRWANGLSGGKTVKPLYASDGRVLLDKKNGGKLQRTVAMAVYPQSEWQSPGVLARESLPGDDAFWYAPAPLAPAVYRQDHTHRQRGVLVRKWTAYVLVVPEHLILTKGGIDPYDTLSRFGLGHDQIEEFLLVAGSEFAVDAATLAMTAGAAFQGNAASAATFLQRNITASLVGQTNSMRQIGFQSSCTNQETCIALFYGAYEFAVRAWKLPG